MIGYLEQLNNLGWGTVVMVLLLLVLALPAVGESISKFVSFFGIETKWSTKDKKNEERFDKFINDFQELKSDVKKLNERFDKLDTDVEALDGKVQNLEQKRNERKIAELKDRIGASYRYYHEKGEWNRMEKEAFEGLIKAYSSLNQNSFVHSVCEPESLTWRIIDEQKE